MTRVIAKATTVLLCVAFLWIASAAASDPMDSVEGWSNEHWLCNLPCGIGNPTPKDEGKTIGLWQTILWADDVGDDSPDNDPYGKCEIDGAFGAETEQQTEYWQDAYGIGVDGIVGTETWETAKYYLVSDGNKLYHFDGIEKNFRLKKVSSGSTPANDWWFWDPVGDSSVVYHKTGHPSTDFPQC